MKVKDIIEAFRQLPEDYETCLSRFFSYEDEIEGAFDVVLDIPVVGIMVNNSSREVRFILKGGDEKAMENAFGDIGIKFPDESQIGSETIN